MEKKWRELERSIKPQAGGLHHVRCGEERPALFPTLFTVGRPGISRASHPVLLYPALVVGAREDTLSTEHGHGWQTCTQFTP